MTKALMTQRLGPVRVTALNSELEIIDKEYEMELLELANIADAVTEKYIASLPELEKLEQNILEEGLLSPIIVCKNSEEAWVHSSIGVISPKEYDPSKQYLCLFGNQRTFIARKHGYTHISALTVDSPFSAITLHHIL
jgi:ParB-like chromosome segregation protein Spo0J